MTVHDSASCLTILTVHDSAPCLTILTVHDNSVAIVGVARVAIALQVGVFK